MSPLANLSKESLFYLIVYSGAVLYGMFSLISIRDDILKASKFKFADGWSILGRPRDDTNDELENFTDYILTAWPCYGLHAITMLLVRKYCPSKQSIAQAIVCLCSCFYLLPAISVICLLLLVTSFFVLTRYHGCSKFLVWTLAVVWMLLINAIKVYDYWLNMLGYTQYYYLIILLSWSILRCCSYALTFVIDKQMAESTPEKAMNISAYNWQYFSGYVLYFPTLVYGPIVSYKRVKDNLLNTTNHTNTNTNPNTHSFQRLLLELARTGFWLFFMHFLMHYLYVQYMSRDVSTFRFVHTVCGRSAVGYLIAQLFFMYYIVTYGLGIAFAKYDGLNPPKRPRCIGCINYYSDMWKHFDEGLYEFLFKHIYSELCKRNSPRWLKTLAAAFTFGFVFVWHGCYDYILLWSCLNFCCLLLENCFHAFLRSAIYATWTRDYMGLQGVALQRIEALLATQLFILAVFTNVYFVGGYDMGKLFMHYTYGSGIVNYFKLMFFCFCYFQSCEILKRYRGST